MVNVYLPNDITLELLMMAARENEDRRIRNEKANITDATIMARIVKDWYKKRMGAKQ